ncbi:MAG: hypothetical protein C5B49_15875 [Bdellovibrio sp.]|nr:MAG: hypothetical protein C5B49_15875 [Bdellovibrio sp.]
MGYRSDFVTRHLLLESSLRCFAGRDFHRYPKEVEDWAPWFFEEKSDAAGAGQRSPNIHLSWSGIKIIDAFKNW